MPRGRKPEPTQLLQLRGSKYGKYRAPEVRPPARPTCPRPRAWLKGEARTHWREVAPELYKLGLLTTLDVPAFTMLCEMWGLYRLAASAVETLCYTDTSGVDHAHPAWRLKRQFADLWMKMACEFGMTPRSRVGLSGVMQQPEDELARFRERYQYFRTP